MARNLKYWLAAAAVLLTVGAGCSGSAQQDGSINAGTGVNVKY